MNEDYNVVSIVGWGQHTIGSHKPIKVCVKRPFETLRIIIYVTGNCTIQNTILDTVTMEAQ